MRAITTSVEAGPDKVLRLQIPVETANQRYELVVVIDSEVVAESAKSASTWVLG